MNTLASGKILSLDGLRAISIFMVIVCHISIGTQYEKLFLPIGSMGVEIFFVISGFLITTLLLRERERSGSINLKKFYIRRAYRILPLLFLFIVTLAILNFVF